MPFQKGNKYGRSISKPITKMIDLCKTGTPEELVTFLFEVALAKVKDPSNPEAVMHVPLNWRTDAAKWLLERRYGKATTNIDVTSHEGAPSQIDYSRFSDAQLAEIERLHEIGSVPAVDAEFTSELASLPEGEPEGSK